MRDLGVLRTGQVGDGAGHFQGAVRGAGRPAQARGGSLQELGGGGLQQHMGVDLLAVQGLVGTALALDGALARLGHALADGRGGFAGRGAQQLLRGQSGHFNVQVDAVEQRAAELGLVARDLVGRAAAGALHRAEVAAGAGVHGRDHLKACRKFGALRRACNGDASGLQRFAQCFERGAWKFGQLIQKQDAVVRERYFARWAEI